MDHNKHSEELKYCTMDIESCYDNIEIEKLTHFLDNDDIICESYVLNTVFLIMPKFLSNNKFKTDLSFKDCFEIKKFHFVTELSEYIHFLDFIRNKPDFNYTYCIVYQHKRTILRKEQFMPRIKHILNNNIIKFNKKFFRQKKGIPQGLSISSFLCNLYFYNIERNLSKKIMHDPNSSNMILRFMDDYLCMSTAELMTQNFFQESLVLSGENKFNFNLKKCKTNVNISAITLQTNTSTDLNTFNWNGINFKLKNIFNIFSDNKIEFSTDQDIKTNFKLINVNMPILTDKSDNSWLFKKINLIMHTGHPWIYFISSINDETTLNQNFEDYCKLVCLKFIILTGSMIRNNIKISKNTFIDVLDSSLKKSYFYFKYKTLKCEKSKFYIRDFSSFLTKFYQNIFLLYYLNGELNNKMVDLSPFLFKSIKKKIYKIEAFLNKKCAQKLKIADKN
jgi:hypothetical protein